MKCTVSVPSLCSHFRALDLYEESVTSGCQFTSNPCPAGFNGNWVINPETLCIKLSYRNHVPDWHVNACQDPGGGTQVQRGAAPALRISRKKGSFFKTSACPRFCKRRVLFCTQVRIIGVKIPLQSTKYTRLWRRVTPEVTGLPNLLPPLAAAKHAEDYKILSQNTFSRSSNVSVLIKEGVFI